MFEITKHIDVSCAHRLEGHFKCSRMHGHNYRIEVTVAGRTLDENGMVLDFGDLKEILQRVHDKIDHMYIISQENMEKGCPYIETTLEEGHGVTLSIKTSTAENLARWVFEQVLMGLLYVPTKPVRVRIWETRSSVAVFEPKDQVLSFDIPSTTVELSLPT